jgi:hypothetical protein
MSHVITCPSGLTGTIRGMKVREERILADRQLARSGGQVDALLAACWEDTIDPGPYPFVDGPIDWGKVLQGDRFFALLQIRIATYGATYAFSVPCEREACRAKIEWELDLAELPVRVLPEASRAALAAGNRFETHLPGGGQKVWFRLLVGEDERKLPQLRRAAPERLFSSLLAFRVLEIEGVEPRAKRPFLEDLPLKDASLLLAELDRVDCGIETAIDIECPECGAPQQVDLPLDRLLTPPIRDRRAARSSTSSLP